jgi:hypothetical protein
MQKYLIIYKQFLEFLETSKNKITYASEIILINLILNNFEAVVGCRKDQLRCDCPIA